MLQKEVYVAEDFIVGGEENEEECECLGELGGGGGWWISVILVWEKKINGLIILVNSLPLIVGTTETLFPTYAI